MPNDSKEKDSKVTPPPPRIPSHDRYLREYNKKMKRLQREANGDNMNHPPDGDYEP